MIEVAIKLGAFGCLTILILTIRQYLKHGNNNSNTSEREEKTLPNSKETTDSRTT